MARNWEVGFLRQPFHQWTKVSWLNRNQGGLLLNNALLSKLTVLIGSNKWIHWKLTEMAAVYRLIKISFELLFYYEEQRISNSMGELWALRAAIKASVKSNMALCATCCVRTWYFKQGPQRSLASVVQIQLFWGSNIKTRGVKCPYVTRTVWGANVWDH